MLMDEAREVLDHREAVQPGECDLLYAEELSGQDSGCLGLEELCPGEVTASRCGIEPGLLQDRPDGGWGSLPAQPGDLSGDAAKSPGRVLGRQLQDQSPDRGPGRWPSRPAPGV